MLTGCQAGAQHSLGCARDKAAPLQEPADALWRIPIDLAAGSGLRFPPNVTAPAVWPQRRREGMDSERRQAPRYPFIADAEVIETASDTKLSAKTSDVSIGGGLLDTLDTFSGAPPDRGGNSHRKNPTHSPSKA